MVKILKELLIGCFILPVIFGCFYLSAFLDIRPTREIETPHFKNEVFHFTFNPLQVMQSCLLELNLQSKDIELQNTLITLSNSFGKQKERVLQNFRLNIQGAAGFFAVEHPKRQFRFVFLPGSGLKLGWLNSDHFVVDQGVYIFFNEQLNSVDKKYFEEMVSQIAYKPTKYVANQYQFTIHGALYTLNLDRNKIQIQLPEQNTHSILIPKGFHISLPKPVNILPKPFSFLAPIDNCSINYYGAKMKDFNTIDLEFEALLAFENTHQADEFLNAIINKFPNWNWQKNYVTVNGTVYALKRENSKTLYICSSPKKYIQNGKIQKQSVNVPMVISGDPKLITNVEQAGWVIALLESIPLYSAITDLTSKTKLVSTNNHKIVWELDKKYFVSGEILKLINTTLD